MRSMVFQMSLHELLGRSLWLIIKAFPNFCVFFWSMFLALIMENILLLAFSFMFVAICILFI